MMDALACVCALLPGDAVYVRTAQTKKAAVAEVLQVSESSIGLVGISVRLVSGFCTWADGVPAWADCVDAELNVKPIDLEEIRF
jgi:hypothetical protein